MVSGSGSKGVLRPITINNGVPMRGWYDIVGMDFRSRADMAGIRFKPDSLPTVAWGEGLLYDPLEPILR